MAPRWPQARRIAEPKAMLVTDVLFTVLWLSAFATQAAYNTTNQCGQVCNLSKAIVGLGVFNTYVPSLVFPSVYFVSRADVGDCGAVCSGPPRPL